MTKTVVDRMIKGEEEYDKEREEMLRLKFIKSIKTATIALISLSDILRSKALQLDEAKEAINKIAWELERTTDD
ncbi:MAG: hypothetical protein ACNYVW_05235 [Methanosarcinales archaeon]